MPSVNVPNAVEVSRDRGAKRRDLGVRERNVVPEGVGGNARTFTVPSVIHKVICFGPIYRFSVAD